MGVVVNFFVDVVAALFGEVEGGEDGGWVMLGRM